MDEEGCVSRGDADLLGNLRCRAPVEVMPRQNLGIPRRQVTGEALQDEGVMPFVDEGRAGRIQPPIEIWQLSRLIGLVPPVAAARVRHATDQPRAKIANGRLGLHQSEKKILQQVLGVGERHVKPPLRISQ